MNTLNIKKTLSTAVFALSSIVATAITPATSVIGTSAAMTGLMVVSSSAQAAQQCGVRTSVTANKFAAGLSKRGRTRRATRKAKRAWESYIQGEEGLIVGSFSVKGATFGLGSRFADLDNAKDIEINCKGAGKNKTYCIVTATPCTES